MLPVFAGSLPVMVVKLTSSAQSLLFTFQDTMLISEDFTRSGGAILGKPNQRALSGSQHSICLPDVWIVLVNLFMNLVYRNDLSLVRLTERQRDSFP